MKMSKNKKWLIITICIVVVLVVIPLFLSTLQRSNIKTKFEDFILDEYGIDVNGDGYIHECYTGCDYYGFFNVGTDYNYAIQARITGDKIEVSSDPDAMELRKQLYDYIVELRGSDIAPNFLGYYYNTFSGIVQYGSGEKSHLYFIIKYHPGMNLDEELAKDYKILQKAQELGNGKLFVKSMSVAYIDDARLDDKDWVKNLGLNIIDYDDIMPRTFNRSPLNQPQYLYFISNYEEDKSLADHTFNEFSTLVREDLQTR